MDAITRRLRRQLEQAIAIGDRAAEAILRAKLEGSIDYRRIGAKPRPEITESELRLLWGDR